jgi:hypothetical protein
MKRKMKLSKKNINTLIKNGKIKPFYKCFEGLVDYRNINHSTFKYPLITLILCITFAIMCGCGSGKSISRVILLNSTKLVNCLKIKSRLVPKNTTIDVFFQNISLDDLRSRIYSWNKSVLIAFNIPSDTFAIDGKCMYSDTSNVKRKDKEQIYSVTLFSHIYQCCVASIEFNYGKTNEAKASFELIKSEINCGNNMIKILTSDAINVNQETLTLINKSDIGYLFTIKMNTPLLMKELIDKSTWISTFRQEDRFFKRKTSVYQVPKNFQTYSKSDKLIKKGIDWKYEKVGLERLIMIERTYKKTGARYIHYYITNLPLTPMNACNLVMKHWLIETNLHGEKDLVFKEDHNQHNHLHTKCVMTTLYNAVLSLYKLYQEPSILHATEKTTFNFDFFVELMGISGVAVQ